MKEMTTPRKPATTPATLRQWEECGGRTTTAQQVNGRWYAPKWGGDTLAHMDEDFAALRAEVERLTKQRDVVVSTSIDTFAALQNAHDRATQAEARVKEWQAKFHEAVNEKLDKRYDEIATLRELVGRAKVIARYYGRIDMGVTLKYAEQWLRDADAEIKQEGK